MLETAWSKCEAAPAALNQEERAIRRTTHAQYHTHTRTRTHKDTHMLTYTHTHTRTQFANPPTRTRNIACHGCQAKIQ